MKRWSFFALCLFATLAFCALGVWQVERRTWKLALIEAVDARVHAPPVSPPDPPRWRSVNAADDAYRHVTVHGRFLPGRDTLVQALTERGPGFWLMSPFQTDRGFIVLVDRGFVPTGWRATTTHAGGPTHGGAVQVSGLLRLTEPGGSLLQANQPRSGRWYSRDIDAIARTWKLAGVAPYFIDADGTPNPGGWPVGGLTVVSFPNNHLLYALTWFALAALSMFGAWRVIRSEVRGR
jgi:surfeit locus 1 family protein